MTPWLLLDLVITLAAIIAAALYITRPVPNDEGVPPPQLTPKQNELRRRAALERIAERKRGIVS